MGRWMARAGQDILAEANILVPVPLHWRRGWSRRFNQAGALAKVIAKAANVPVTGNALCRIRATQQQVGLSKSERASNVQGAFAIPLDKKPLIEGRHVVLIDDVLTSGATIDACARTLLRAKARQVDVLVFARVVEGFRNPI
jgi:ComF family protein